MTSEKFRTEQEQFWAGEFGDEYIDRNKSQQLLASNLVFFSKALRHAQNVNSCIEFGANIGMNLRALHFLYPELDRHGIEINLSAAEELCSFLPKESIYNQSLLDFQPERKWDLVLIKGVLIHINPKYLETAYRKLFESTSRYILVGEYYNPSPVSISYRGHSERLFKRDFAGEMLDMLPALQLLDYGFTYHRDPSFPQDDMTWFLLGLK